MIGGARRQLPSWMVRSAADDQASISEMKEGYKDNDYKELDTRACKPQKKVQRNQHDIDVTLLEDKSHLLKKCETRTRKRKLIKQDEEHQGDNKDESDQAKKVNVKAGKKFQCGDEPHLLTKCVASRRKMMSNKQHEDQSDESDMEKKVNPVMRNRYKGNALRRRKQKAEEIIDGSLDGTLESTPSDDGLTMEDLISIAEEYVNADKDMELQKAENVGYGTETRPTTNYKTGLEEDLTPLLESRNTATDKPLPTTRPLMEPSFGGASIINLGKTGDPVRDMLDLFLGPLLKTTEEAERKIDAMNEEIILDHECSKRSQNDTVAEMASLTKKKSSLKDKIAMLLD